jgi:recombination protein RecA
LNDDSFHLQTIGSQIAVKIVKNKHAPPFKTAQFELEFGKGICRSSELFELGLKHKLIRKSGGSYYSFNGKAFNGKSNLKSYLTENKSVANDLEMELKRLMGTDASKEQEAGDSSQSDFPEESVTPEASSEEDLGAIIEG